MSNPLVEQIAKQICDYVEGEDSKPNMKAARPLAHSILATVRDAPVFSSEPARIVVVEAVARLEHASERMMKTRENLFPGRSENLAGMLLIEAVAIAREAAMLKRELINPSRTEPLEKFYSEYWQERHRALGS